MSRFCHFLYILILLSITFGQVSAQKRRKFGETKFGVQFSPIVPSDIIRQNSQEITTNENITYKIEQKPSLLFGMEIRHNFTNTVALQTGINYLRRNYNVSILDHVTGFENNTRLKLVSYEIPVMGLIYVKVSDKFYMNNSFGVSCDFLPSDITWDRVLVVRRSWIQPALVSNVGFEIRTEKSGYFYLGASYQYMFKDMLSFNIYYDRDLTVFDNYQKFRSSGNYFAINFKYFFHSYND